MTLLFIMILSLWKGAVEAGGIPMWHEPDAAAGQFLRSADQFFPIRISHHRWEVMGRCFCTKYISARGAKK